MKLRSEIPNELKWDINLFNNKEEIEKILKHFEFFIEDVKKYNGKFNNPDMFFDFYFKNLNKSIEINHLYHYVGNMLSVDGTNVELKKLEERIEILAAKQSKAYSFVEPQLYKLSTKYLKELLNDPRAKDIENIIKQLIISKKHKIDEKTSKVISDLNRRDRKSVV